jgi:hypothetical protein
VDWIQVVQGRLHGGLLIYKELLGALEAEYFMSDCLAIAASFCVLSRSLFVIRSFEVGCIVLGTASSVLKEDRFEVMDFGRTTHRLYLQRRRTF